MIGEGLRALAQCLLPLFLAALSLCTTLPVPSPGRPGTPHTMSCCGTILCLILFSVLVPSSGPRGRLFVCGWRSLGLYRVGVAEVWLGLIGRALLPGLWRSSWVVGRVVGSCQRNYFADFCAVPGLGWVGGFCWVGRVAGRGAPPGRPCRVLGAAVGWGCLQVRELVEGGVPGALGFV
jgi:hypothetical protein